MQRRFLTFDLGKAGVIVLEDDFEDVVAALWYFIWWEGTCGDCTLKAVRSSQREFEMARASSNKVLG